MGGQSGLGEELGGKEGDTAVKMLKQKKANNKKNFKFHYSLLKSVSQKTCHYSV